MKSLDKKKTKELDWKKELKLLAKQFPIFNADIKGLEQFIQSLLSQQRQEILELECLKEEKIWKRYYSNSGAEIILVKERNQLRSQIKEQIKSLEKK